MQEWFVARTQPRREKVAQVNLENQGIPTFLPCFRQSSRRFKRFEEALCPLFPGYIFFQSLRDPALWRSVGGTIGVSHVIWGDGRAPRPVPEIVMLDLLSACPDGVFVGALSSIVAGDEVTVSRGPFSGLLATVQSLDARGRLDLLLSAMGGVNLRLDVSDMVRS